MDALNYKQLATKYPLCPNGESSEGAWAKLLAKWREDGKLEQRKHWRYGPSTEGNNQPTRYYEVPRLVRLICLEARGEMPRPRISYLYSEFYDDFVAVLSESVAGVASVAGVKAEVNPA